MIEMNFCEAYCSAAMIDSTSCMSVCVCMCPNFIHALSLIVSLTCAHLCLRVEMEGC